MSVRKSPIPSIALQGADNTEEVLVAIHDFRATHDAAATEDVVHDWFDEQTEDLSEAIAANLRLQKHNQMRMESAQDRSSIPIITPRSRPCQNERTLDDRALVATRGVAQLAGELSSYREDSASADEGAPRRDLPPQQNQARCL